MTVLIDVVVRIVLTKPPQKNSKKKTIPIRPLYHISIEIVFGFLRLIAEINFLNPSSASICCSVLAQQTFMSTVVHVGVPSDRSETLFIHDPHRRS